jgi:hypothetical protein
LPPAFLLLLRPRGERAARTKAAGNYGAPRRSAEPRTQRRTSGERARAHAEARAERRRDVAQKVATAGATAVIADGAGGVGAQPVTTRVALRIDALHGETRQILHRLSPQAAGQLGIHRNAAGARNCLPATKTNVAADCGARSLWCQEKTPLSIGVRLLAAMAPVRERAGSWHIRCRPSEKENRPGPRSTRWKPGSAALYWVRVP